MNHSYCRSFLLGVFSILTLLACQQPASQQKHVTKPGFDLDDLYSTPSLIGTSPQKPVWSKEGNHLLFLWNEAGYSFRDVWTYTVNTGSKQRLTQLAQSDSSGKKNHNGISEAVWLDVTEFRIAYVLDGSLYFKSGSDKPFNPLPEMNKVRNLAVSSNARYLAFSTGSELWQLSIETQNLSPPTRLFQSASPKTYIESFHWSSDSQNLTFKLTDNNPLPQRDIHYYANQQLQKDQVLRAFPGQNTAHFKIGLVDKSGQNIQIFERPDDAEYIWDYALSSDGKSLLMNTSDLLVKNHRVYVYDVASGERELFYQEQDPKHLRPDWQVAWAPEDDGLIILTDKDGFLHLYHKSTAISEPRALTDGEWEIADFKVNHTQKTIYFTANKSDLPERQIYSVSMSGNDVQRISNSIPGTHQFQLSTHNNHISSLFSNDSKPLELYVLNTNNQTTTQVTQSPLNDFNQFDWADISYIEFPSHIDGTNLVGRLSLPADYDSTKKYPLIVGSVYSDSVRNQYGGRTSHPTWGFDQYLVSQGYIVLNVNVRGSWGQGREHNQGLKHSYGVIDIEDLHSGVKYLVNKAYVDPDRVGIWGSSYGGLMTMMSLFKKPGVYAAGIAGAPATNVAHAYPGQMWVMGEPSGDDQPARYENQSALYHTDGLEDPLMIIHGTKDPVVLYSDTIAVVEKLIAKQKMFELVTLPGTSHGWDNEGNDVRLFSFKKMVAFFDRHLK